MKKIFLFLLFTNIIFSQVITDSKINFTDYFENKTLRIDYSHTGDKDNDEYYLEELIEEPFWGGSHKNLIDTFNYGKYQVVVKDDSSRQIIYSRFYSTLFSEWQTTEEAKHTKKSFPESVIIPYPKNKVIVEFYTRKKDNSLVKKIEINVEPKNYFISKERRKNYQSFEVQKFGDPSVKVDIVIIPEGYTKEQMELFKSDCKKFTNYLFNASPYKENKDKFNIWGVEAPSADSGSDIPAENIWKNTLLNTNYYTFDTERYLMTTDYQTVRDIASNTPYDQIYILVNSNKYGGGSIYNFYNVGVNRNPREEYVFVHEFGHGFAFLADEYYDSETSYQDFYPLNVEPLEPNLTTLVNFDKKWKNMIDKDTPVPTPTEEKYFTKVGAFEGGGYVAKGVYRPMYDCSMRSASVNNFCPVCKDAIIKMIKFYSE
ncbi:MAG: IgA Peptidase M64 [Ignavibacterium sp.]